MLTLCVCTPAILEIILIFFSVVPLALLFFVSFFNRVVGGVAGREVTHFNFLISKRA